MQSFCRSNKGEHFLFSWEDKVGVYHILEVLNKFSIPVESRQLMFPWWMLRPEPEVDLDVMHHAEDVEDDSDRVWVGHVLFLRKRHRREKDKQRDAELPLWWFTLKDLALLIGSLWTPTCNSYRTSPGVWTPRVDFNIQNGHRSAKNAGEIWWVSVPTIGGYDFKKHNMLDQVVT